MAAPQTPAHPFGTAPDLAAGRLPHPTGPGPLQVLWTVIRGILLTAWYAWLLILLGAAHVTLTAAAVTAVLVAYLLAPPRGRRRIRTALARLPLVLALPVLLLLLPGVRIAFR